jgi:hypothetical protein
MTGSNPRTDGNTLAGPSRTCSVSMFSTAR